MADILWVVVNSIYDHQEVQDPHRMPMYDGLCVHIGWGGGEPSQSYVHSLVNYPNTVDDEEYDLTDEDRQMYDPEVCVWYWKFQETGKLPFEDG